MNIKSLAITAFLFISPIAFANSTPVELPGQTLLDVAQAASSNKEVFNDLSNASVALVSGANVFGQPVDANTKSIIAQIHNLSDGDLIKYTQIQIAGCEKLPTGFFAGKKRKACFFTVALLTTEMQIRGRAQFCADVDSEKLSGDHAADMAMIDAQAHCDFDN